MIENSNKLEEIKKYYTLDRILREKANYNIIFGERSNGKTYAVENKGIEDYFKHGWQMALIRRYELDFTGKRGQQMFDALVQNGVVEKYSKGEYNSITYYSARWYFSKYDKKAKKNILAPEPFCFAFSLSSGEHDKSTSYPKIKNILFDEFIARGAYLPDEFILFMNTISTIVRDRIDVNIFLLGNTINNFCPYFAEMGLTNVQKMDYGAIDIYRYGDSDLKVAVERCKPNKEGKKSDTLFAFNNPKLAMITHGGWEIAIYPHLPYKYKREDIRYTYFIEFENFVLQCEIVQLIGNIDFTFIHRKTSALRIGKNDKVYSNKYNGMRNYTRRITKPETDLDKKIYRYFTREKVFYQDNELGEIVRNYLMWSKTDTGIL